MRRKGRECRWRCRSSRRREEIEVVLPRASRVVSRAGFLCCLCPESRHPNANACVHGSRRPGLRWMPQRPCRRRQAPCRLPDALFSWQRYFSSSNYSGTQPHLKPIPIAYTFSSQFCPHWELLSYHPTSRLHCTFASSERQPKFWTHLQTNRGIFRTAFETLKQAQQVGALSWWVVLAARYQLPEDGPSFCPPRQGFQRLCTVQKWMRRCCREGPLRHPSCPNSIHHRAVSATWGSLGQPPPHLPNVEGRGNPLRSASSIGFWTGRRHAPQLFWQRCSTFPNLCHYFVQQKGGCQ